MAMGTYLGARVFNGSQRQNMLMSRLTCQGRGDLVPRGGAKAYHWAVSVQHECTLRWALAEGLSGIERGAVQVSVGLPAGRRTTPVLLCLRR